MDSMIENSNKQLVLLQQQLSDVSQFSGQDCEKYSDSKHGH